MHGEVEAVVVVAAVVHLHVVAMRMTAMMMMRMIVVVPMAGEHRPDGARLLEEERRRVHGELLPEVGDVVEEGLREEKLRLQRLEEGKGKIPRKVNPLSLLPLPSFLLSFLSSFFLFLIPYSYPSASETS